MDSTWVVIISAAGALLSAVIGALTAILSKEFLDKRNDKKRNEKLYEYILSDINRLKEDLEDVIKSIERNAELLKNGKFERVTFKIVNDDINGRVYSDLSSYLSYNERRIIFFILSSAVIIEQQYNQFPIGLKGNNISTYDENVSVQNQLNYLLNFIKRTKAVVEKYTSNHKYELKNIIFGKVITTFDSNQESSYSILSKKDFFAAASTVGVSASMGHKFVFNVSANEDEVGEQPVNQVKLKVK